MSLVKELTFLDDVFSQAAKMAHEAEFAKKKPSATVLDYFEVLEQLDRAKGDLYRLGGKYGATLFGGAFDLRQVCKVYMEQPGKRALINEIVGLS